MLILTSDLVPAGHAHVCHPHDSDQRSHGRGITPSDSKPMVHHAAIVLHWPEISKSEMGKHAHGRPVCARLLERLNGD